MKLKDDRTIPASFKQFTYGYANTSHAAQGKTVDRGILMMGEKAIQAGELRQGYVSNSRFTESQAIYTTDLKGAKEAMSTEKDRMLALDLMRRRKEAWQETTKRIRVKNGKKSMKRFEPSRRGNSTGLHRRHKNGAQNSECRLITFGQG
jgi:hypothetical protein